MTEIRTIRNDFGELEVSASDGRHSGRLRLEKDRVHLRGDFSRNPVSAAVVPLLIAALGALAAENGDTE